MHVRVLALPLVVALALLVMPLQPAAQQTATSEPTSLAPYVPTPQDVVERMLALANVTAKDTVYDLGCGDGRIIIAAAKRGARGVGIDIDPERIAEANENARKAGVADRVKIIEQNLFDADFSEATVVTLYLVPQANLRLRRRLLSEL